MNPERFLKNIDKDSPNYKELIFKEPYSVFLKMFFNDKHLKDGIEIDSWDFPEYAIYDHPYCVLETKKKNYNKLIYKRNESK